ncbi:NFX1-type zinc finger-containing protein 1 [Sceloporus undulatus]|uniref:NFX1-type zinc finger-containing protein 1 n=1 Tax=Sceloporus undulatus TaxID=8520 RepID=UPI001C4C0E10|nr:NFX1-type zinc finger-containing protein 1 [Sceloporus undulatus]
MEGRHLRLRRLRPAEQRQELPGRGGAPGGLPRQPRMGRRIVPPEPQRNLQRGAGGTGPQRGGGRPSPRGAARQGPPQHQRIGAPFLEELLQKEPSEVAITLASSPGLEEALSQTALRPHFLQLLCQALRRACSSRTDRHSIQRLLGLVKESAFLRICLPQYVAGMLTETVPAVRHQYPQHIADIVALVQELAGVFPASSIQSVAMLMSLLPASVNALRASGVDFAEEAERELERVQAYVQHLQERRREGTLRVDSQTRVGGGPKGEEGDYRAMSIFPTYQELHQEERPFLRPNTLAQPYEGPGVYLETHFRLLREDFVRPMREGIVQLLQCAEQQGLRQRRFDDIRVYFNARILAPTCSATGIEYKVQFDTKPLRSVRWENSKRLLYGSLICLSKDGFETFLFATVCHRESRELQEGLVHLSFTERSRPLLAEAWPSDSFLMVETAAYFEAYRHVLQGLQELREEELPFQRYIVRCEAEVAAPGYLRGSGSTYDLRCLLGKPDGPEEEEEEHKQGEISAVNILNPQQWPSKEALGLDESQKEALCLALTKELAIIQGPPGTGKTYVGLKIVQALLDNNTGWGRSPILVVCYTNHALDQFLEGIHVFQKKGIVRVGGRSNSESLKQFTLRELRSQGQFRKDLPHHLRTAHFSVSSQMQEAQDQLTKEAAILECGLNGVLHERHLRNCILDRHWESLAGGWDEDWLNPKGSLILEWLGLGATPFARSAPDPEEAEPPGAPEEEEDPEGELLPIPEEAALIQEERLLDSDQRQRRPRPPREVAELENLFLALRLKGEAEDEADKQQAGKEGVWQIQPGQKKKIKQRVKAELQKQDRMTEAEAEAVQDIWSLDWGSRWRLYRHWVHKHQTEIRRKILRHEESYQVAADRLAELRLQEDLWVLKQAQIVGMTTTGAARYRQVLQEVGPRVVVVEEAAEVLEAHTITTLSSSCQHLILIGDHQQLRPSANVYDLAKNFHLEVSLFERLVKAGLPFVRLNFQHRMRPEIARLLTPHIYQDLENHPSVLQYENIKGVLSNLFFVEHNFPEQEIQEGRSHQNPHEAHFLVALCKYLLCQGYLPSQITILTTYTGQLFCLRRLLPAKTFDGVKVHVVDKYQGEENDIVLLSLVRSNPEGRVGFLQASNRICVALSRARKGLFCIGNLGMLSQVPLWSKILHTLREKGQAGHALVLSCQNHPENRTEVARAADFDEVPEGGCSRPCEARLNCGHACTRACHPYDPLHQEFQCMKPCQKVLCQDGHRCPERCFQPCGKCKVKVPKTLPQCGHQQQVPCTTPAEKFCCQEPCGRVLRCGHKCKLTCGQECARRCPEMVPVTLMCGHSQEVECSTAAEVRDGRPVHCQAKCPSILECGHMCPGSCHSCFAGRFHQPCQRACTRLLICSHKCQQPCTSDCPPCQRPCQNRCVHSCCQKTCGEPCPPCMEPCEWRCQHYQCSRLCSEPCNRPRCEAACPKRLLCGHPCAGVCGEPCPQKCLVCNREELTQIFFGFEDEPGTRFVQLEDCGHVFETQGLDCYMDDPEEEGAEEQSMAVKLKVCPACQTPIRKNLRYGALVKKSLAEVELVKGKIQGRPEEIASGAQRLKVALEEKDILKIYMPKEYEQLLKQLEGPPALSIQRLGYLENLLGLYAWLAELTKAAKKGDSGEWEGAKRRLAEVAGWLRRPRLSFTGQQLDEIQREVLRLSYLVELLGRCQAARGRMDNSAEGTVSTLRQLLEGPGKFNPDDEQLVKAEMEALKAVLPTSGLGISEAEKQQIVAAVTGTSRGHWFKCPNGHIYVITECGGAMERRQCPECQATIGGDNHRLEADNQLAPEMDGATHAAWSNEANDLLNVAVALNWMD